MNLAINDEVKRLTRMITEYLDITRLESGAIAMRPAAVRADILLERTLLLLDPVAAQRQIRLVRRFAPDLPPFLADPDLLSRAFENLVSNAIKYSPDGTEVSIVGARADDEEISIEVADQGYGIPEADLARIFEKFYRVPRVQDAGHAGHRPRPRASCAKSRNCIAAPSPSAAKWDGAPHSPFASRVRRLPTRRRLTVSSLKRGTQCPHNRTSWSPTTSDRSG